MKRFFSPRRFRLGAALSTTLLLLVVLAGNLGAAGSMPSSMPLVDETYSFTLTRTIDSKNFEFVIGRGERQGRWHAKLKKSFDGLERGRSGRVTAAETTFNERKGPATFGFKGSDEELQAIVDWLGSLE
jgi:hypothetical protein